MTTPINPKSTPPLLPGKSPEAKASNPVTSLAKQALTEQETHSSVSLPSPASSSDARAFQPFVHHIWLTNRLPDAGIMPLLWLNEIYEGCFPEITPDRNMLIINYIEFDPTSFPPDRAYKIKQLEFPLSPGSMILHDGHEFQTADELVRYLNEHPTTIPGNLTGMPALLPNDLVKYFGNSYQFPMQIPQPSIAKDLYSVKKQQLLCCPMASFCESYLQQPHSEYLKIASDRGREFYYDFIGFLISEMNYQSLNQSDKAEVDEAVKKLSPEELEAFFTKAEKSDSAELLLHFICCNAKFLFKKHPSFTIKKFEALRQDLFEWNSTFLLHSPKIMCKIISCLRDSEGLEALFLKLFRSPDFNIHSSKSVVKDSFVKLFLYSDFYRNSSAEFKVSLEGIFRDRITSCNTLYWLECQLEQGIPIDEDLCDNALTLWNDNELNKLLSFFPHHPHLAARYSNKLNEGFFGNPEPIRCQITNLKLNLVPFLANSGIKFEANDFKNPDNPINIVSKLYTFLKNEFPEDYKRICLNNFISANYFIELFEAGDFQINDIPDDYLVRYLNHLEDNEIVDYEYILMKLISFFYERNLPLNFGDEPPDILLYAALRLGRTDLAIEFHTKTKAKINITNLLPACNTVKAIVTLLKTNIVPIKELSGFLAYSIRVDNFEVIELFSDPQVIQLLEASQQFFPLPLLKQGLERCPMLDIAIALDGSDDAIFQLFSPYLEPSGVSIKTRLAEMFVLNSVDVIEAVVNRYVAGRVSPEMFATINAEIALFKEIGTLVARSRHYIFFRSISKLYHKQRIRPLSASMEIPERTFTIFAKTQVEYGRGLLEQVQSSPNDYSLFQLYGRFSKKSLKTVFLNETSNFRTAIIDRYTPFFKDIDITRAQAPSHELLKKRHESPSEFCLDNESLTFTTYSPLHPDEPILLTSITADSLCYYFNHTKIPQIKKYLPFHIAHFEELKKPVKIESEGDFNILIDSIAEFVWHNSHFCITNTGNAQITMNIMKKFFDIHNIDVGPTRLDVTFIDCKALSMIKAQFISEFRSYFERPPSLKEGRRFA